MADRHDILAPARPGLLFDQPAEDRRRPQDQEAQGTLAFLAHPPCALAGQYQQLINEDITMTNAVQGGAMTRAQRRERLETLIAQIEEAEKQHVAANEGNAEEENKKVRQVLDGVRGFSM
jgi:antitoxin component of MazEF toxin-antitoxin module